MAFIPVADCVQARLQWQNDAGGVAQNVFYCATAGTPTETDLTEIGDAFGSWLTESWVGAHSQAWKAVGVILRSMSEEEGIEIDFTTGFPYTGTLTDPPLPDQVAYTLTWGTGLVGRSARGRSYGLGLVNGQTVGHSRLSDGTQAALTERWGNLLPILSDAGHSLQVVSFIDAGVPRSAGRKLPALSGNARFPLATQRRRLP
jgi:hypothetical protein